MKTTSFYITNFSQPSLKAVNFKDFFKTKFFSEDRKYVTAYMLMVLLQWNHRIIKIITCGVLIFGFTGVGIFSYELYKRWNLAYLPPAVHRLQPNLLPKQMEPS